jgi:hypothetical protein
LPGPNSPKVFRVGNGEFLLGPESRDSVANFLRLGHAHGNRSDCGDEPDDAVVLRPAVKSVDEVAHARAVGEHVLGDGGIGRVFDHLAVEIHFQNRLRRDGAFVVQDDNEVDGIDDYGGSEPG